MISSLFITCKGYLLYNSSIKHTFESMRYTVNWAIFVYENIHELNFRVNKFSLVPGLTKIFLHEIFVTLKL